MAQQGIRSDQSTIKEATVLLWCAMKREHAAHKDQNADVYEALRMTAAVREYELSLKSPATPPAARRSDERGKEVPAYGRTEKVPEIDENQASRKGRAATHSARSLQLEVVDEVMPTDDSQGLGLGSRAPRPIIRPDNE